MQRDEWKRLARLAAMVYLPIALLFVFIFLIVSYEQAKIEAIPTHTLEGGE